MTVLTSNIASSFALWAYSWESSIPDSNLNSSAIPISLGAHYLEFSRSKKFGGSLNVSCNGPMRNIKIGDWVVLVMSAQTSLLSLKTIAEVKKSGQVKFIGQISSISVQNLLDGSGNRRIETLITAREWSHVFTMPFRLDQRSLLMTAQKPVPLRQTQETSPTTARGILAAAISKLGSSYFNPFSYATLHLSMIGALSDKNTVVPGFEALKVLDTITKLPVVPEQLFKDWIQTPTSPRYSTGAPWISGFCTQLIGVPSYPPGKDFFTSPLSLENRVSPKKTNRPTALLDPAKLASTASISDAVMAQFAETRDLYEFYGDIFYENGVAKPAIVMRDKPMSYRRLWKAHAQDEGSFGWTHIDNIPRVTIPIQNVTRLTTSYELQSSYNFVRIDFSSNSINAQGLNAQATSDGYSYDISAMERFGTISYDRQVDTHALDANNRSTLPAARQWFRALAMKIQNFNGYRYLFPDASVSIKDAGFPLTVGLMVQIPLGDGKFTLVGQVEAIKVQAKITNDGQTDNQTIVDLTSVGYVALDSTDDILPLPFSAHANPFIPIAQVPESDFKEIEEKWILQAPGART